MQNQPPMAPSESNFNSLTNNPNGSDWMAKFNRPNVMTRSSNYLGTTTRKTKLRCHYVMEMGHKTKVCK